MSCNSIFSSNRIRVELTVEIKYTEKYFDYLARLTVVNAGRLPVVEKVARQNVATCPN